METDKRILFIMPEYTLGGAETQERMLIEAFEENNISTAVYILHLIGNYNDRNLYAAKSRMHHVDFYELSLNGKTDYEVRYVIKKDLNDNEREKEIKCVVMFHEYTTPLIPFFHQYDIPVIYSERLDAKRVINDSLFCKALLECDALSCNSIGARRQLETFFEQKVHYIRNGKKIQDQICFDRRKIKNLLVPCRISRVKNLEVVVRFFNRYCKEGDYHIRIVGDIEDSAYKAALEMLLDKEISRQTFEIVGYVQDMNQEYAWADLVVLPSLAEGTPNVVLEAFMLGRPIIVSDIEAERDVVMDSQLRFNPFSEEELYATLSYVDSLSDAAYNEMMTKHRRFVEENYSVSKMVGAYSQLIGETIENYKKRGSLIADYNDEEYLSVIHEYDKMLSFYFLLTKWVDRMQSGMTLGELCLSRGWNAVAIYGYREIGKLVYKELKKSSIQIVCVIDKNASQMMEDIKIIEPEEASSVNVDVIIVTAIYHMNEITAAIENKVKCDVISLKDIIEKYE